MRTVTTPTFRKDGLLAPAVDGRTAFGEMASGNPDARTVGTGAVSGASEARTVLGAVAPCIPDAPAVGVGTVSEPLDTRTAGVGVAFSAVDARTVTVAVASGASDARAIGVEAASVASAAQTLRPEMAFGVASRSSQSGAAGSAAGPASTLGQRAIRSAAWTLPTSIGSRAVGLIGTLMLARYLAPDEYGVAMAASIAATTASSVTTFGVGIYLVANPKMSRAETFHATCWFLITGVIALLGTLSIGHSLGHWFSAPGLAKFLPLLIVAAFLERLVYVPERILVRNLRFGWLSVARGIGELTYTIASVTLAASGGGAMAIVWGSLARSAIRFAAIVPAVPLREWLEPHRLRLASLIEIVKYGTNVSVASIATFGVRRWDSLLISRYFGPAAMGAYNYAYNLADTPATAIGEQMSDVIAASFAHVDQRRRAKALVRSCAMVALIMFPISIGLAAVAPTVIETFFDTRWSNIGAMLICLSALSVARPLGSILTAYFYASGRPNVILWLEWASLIGVITAVATLGRINIYWACICVGGVFVLRTLTAMWVVRRQDGVALSEFLQPMTRPFIVCLVMAAGVTATRIALVDVTQTPLTPPLRLIVEIAAGAAIYVVGVLLVARESCLDLLRTAGIAGFTTTATTATTTTTTITTAAVAATERPALPRIPRVLSLSTEFPNPSEPGKGLFVRARLAAIRARTSLSVVAPVAMLDYANPHGNLLAASHIPRDRRDGAMEVLHPRWLYPPKGGWMNAFFLCIRLLPVLIKLLARRTLDFDVIDAHFAHPEGIAAVALGRIVGRPVFITIRGSELRYRSQRSKRFWMSWALRRADRVIAVSEGLRALAIDLGADPRRVRTVPNGIDAGMFYRRDRGVCRTLHGIAPDERIILCAGDLAELKGFHRAITAVKNLNDRGLTARLLIAGGVGRSGRYAETLRQQVASDGLADRVTFLGEATQPVLAELMSSADVFCLASRTEGWPNVVNEALACGTPVVATDVGAVRQMIVSDRLGAIVPLQDGEASIDGLTEALRMALTRSWDHEEIAAHGRSRSWSQVADDVLEEMRAVMAERAS